MSRRQIILCITSSVIGLIIWKGILFLHSMDLDFDKTLYLPLLCIVSMIFGFLESKKFYLWGIAIMILPIIVTVGGNFLGEPDSTFGLAFGVLGFIFFMIPAVLSSYIGARVKTFIQNRQNHMKKAEMERGA